MRDVLNYAASAFRSGSDSKTLERIIYLLSDSHVRTKLLSDVYSDSNVIKYLKNASDIVVDPTLLYPETLLIVKNSNLSDDVKTMIAKTFQISTPPQIPTIDLNIILQRYTDDDPGTIKENVSTHLDLRNSYISVPAHETKDARGFRAARVEFLTVDRAARAGVMPFIFIPNDAADGVNPSFVSNVAHNMARYPAGILQTSDTMERHRIDIIQEILDFMYNNPQLGWRHKFTALYKAYDIQGVAMYNFNRYWSNATKAEDRAALELRSVRGPRPSGGHGTAGNPALRAAIEALNYQRGIRRRRAIRPVGGRYPGPPLGRMQPADKAWFRCTITPFGHFVRFLIEFWRQNAERIEDYDAVYNGNIPALLQHEIDRFQDQADILDRRYNRFRHCFCSNSKVIDARNDVTTQPRRNYLFHYDRTPSVGAFQGPGQKKRGGYRPFKYENDQGRRLTGNDDIICLLAMESPDVADVNRWLQLTHGTSACVPPPGELDPAVWPKGFGRYLDLMTQIREFIHADAAASPSGVDPNYSVTTKYFIPPNILDHNIAYNERYSRGDKAIMLLEIGAETDEFLYRVSTVPEDPLPNAPVGGSLQDISTTVQNVGIPFYWRKAV